MMVLNNVYPLFIVLVATHAYKRNKQSHLRVYNGMDDVTSNYPYVVCLKGGYDIATLILRVCTGSLITATWVISASHCLTSLITYVQYGNLTIPIIFTPSKSKVHKIIRHPRYVEAMSINDVGLLLVSPVLLSKYGSLSAVDYRTLGGQPVEYAGYGQTFLNNNSRGKLNKFIQDVLRPLQIGEAVVMYCDGEYLPRNLICVSSKCSHKQTILPGDSGGPLVFDKKIVGVACAITTDYSAQSFTPVSPHITWIQHVMATQSFEI